MEINSSYSFLAYVNWEGILNKLCALVLKWFEEACDANGSCDRWWGRGSPGSVDDEIGDGDSDIVIKFYASV
jgi:hypothetical protein